MHFFKKLFGSLSHLNKKNDYARATLEYATSFKTFKSDKTDYNNRDIALEAEDKFGWRFSVYNRMRRINNIDVMDIEVTDSKKQRISVTLYRYLTSKTYQFISRH
jgi:hypothetical protein